jgi:hypothetical protein
MTSVRQGSEPWTNPLFPHFITCATDSKHLTGLGLLGCLQNGTKFIQPASNPHTKTRDPHSSRSPPSLGKRVAAPRPAILRMAADLGGGSMWHPGDAPSMLHTHGMAAAQRPEASPLCKNRDQPCDPTRDKMLLSARPRGSWGLIPRDFGHFDFLAASGWLPGATMLAQQAGASGMKPGREVDYKKVLGYAAIATRQPRREGPLRAPWRRLQVAVHFAVPICSSTAEGNQ